MRSRYLVLALTIMTTFGWILHSSLDLFYSQQTISISTLTKAISTLKSFENTQIVISNSGKDYIHNTDERLASLERNFKSYRIQHKATSAVIIAKTKSVKEFIEKSEVAREIKLYQAATKILTVKHITKDLPSVIKATETIEKDQFSFQHKIQTTTVSYALNYKAMKNYDYIAFHGPTEKKELKDEVKLAMASPTKTKEKLSELSEEELKLDESDELILKNLDDEATAVPLVEDKTDTVKVENKTTTQEDHSLEIDDLNTYEYSTLASDQNPKTEDTSPLIKSSAVSSSVSQVIGREMQNNTMGPYKFEKIPKTTVPDTTTLASNAPVTNPMINYSGLKTGENKNKTQLSTQMNTQLKIRSMSLNLLGKKQGLLREFDYQSVYDVNELRSSDEKGELDLTFPISRTGMKAISLRSDEHLKTNMNVELNIEDDNEILVPMIDGPSLEAYLVSRNIEASGGFLLIKIDGSVETVGLDKTFSGFVNFDEKLKVTQDESKAQYVLYLGVAPGNVLVTVKMKEGATSYITHVSENELTYDYLSMNKLSFQKIELTVEELMSKKALPLNIPGEEILSFSSNKKSQKLNMNTYEFTSEFTKADTQNYFEIKNKEMNVFFGVKTNQKIVIPSQSYQDEIYNLFHVKEPNQVCIVQINLDAKKKLDNIRSLAQTVDGQDNFNLMALDKDGTIGEDVSDTTSKIFFKGEHQGVLNLELNFVDNTQESIQTFCSQGIYLIEQR